MYTDQNRCSYLTALAAREQNICYRYRDLHNGLILFVVKMSKKEVEKRLSIAHHWPCGSKTDGAQWNQVEESYIFDYLIGVHAGKDSFLNHWSNSVEDLIVKKLEYEKLEAGTVLE
jgi:hypothetical protein